MQLGVMGPERARSDQGCITPGERLFKDAAITQSTKLCSPPSRRSKTTIETDSEHQTNRGLLNQ